MANDLIQSIEDFLEAGGEPPEEAEQTVRFTVRHGITPIPVEDGDILFEWRWITQEDIDREFGT